MMITSYVVLMRIRPSLELVDHGGDQSSPARLVRRAQPPAGVAVEVLVEEDVIAEVGVLPHLLRGAEERPAAVRPRHEDTQETPGQLVGHLAERQQLPRAGRALDLEARPVIVVEASEALDQQVVDRHPDRPASARIATEEPGVRLAGRVGHLGALGSPLEDVGMLEIVSGKSPEAEVAAELVWF